jgi:hypothetical protein
MPEAAAALAVKVNRAGVLMTVKQDCYIFRAACVCCKVQEDYVVFRVVVVKVEKRYFHFLFLLCSMVNGLSQARGRSR